MRRAASSPLHVHSCAELSQGLAADNVKHATAVPSIPKTVFSLMVNCPCSGDGDKYASWEDVDTSTIQFLSLDHADGSPAMFTNDYTLGDMLYGGTSQAESQAKSAWRRVK